MIVSYFEKHLKRRARSTNVYFVYFGWQDCSENSESEQVFFEWISNREWAKRMLKDSVNGERSAN